MVENKYFTRTDGLKLAYRKAEGAGPTFVFLPGYMSDMAGGKATAVFDWALANGKSCLLLDYAGCGESEGDFALDFELEWGRGGRITSVVASSRVPRTAHH